jgi:peptidoglycan/xylan/chitin deacetylase (PgdA/CDA1 family)
MGAVPRHIAQLGRRWMPAGLWEGPADRRWVALTIDDGPHPDLTPRLLAALREARAPATFFVVGERGAAQPALVRQMQAEGHEIGNHTWTHRALTYGACRPALQVERTEELLGRLCPGSLRVFRPPFGFIGAGGGAALARHRLTPVYWSVVPGDWDPTRPEAIRARVRASAHPGAVIVLHGGRPWQAGTARALPGLADDLRADGYEIVPLSRMLTAAGHGVATR